MGIKNFSLLTRKKGSSTKNDEKKLTPSSHGKKEINIEIFAHHRIAIDGTNWLYTYKYNCQKDVIQETDVLHQPIDQDQVMKNILSSLRVFVNKFIYKEILPIFVFDGEAPIEKQLTREKRKKDKAKIFQDIENEKLRLIQLEELELGSIGLENNDSKRLLFDNLLDLKRLKELYSKVVILTNDETLLIKKVLISLGIPVLQATGEGEELCSALATDRIVKGVFSEDLDNLPRGCPYLITHINYQGCQIYDLEALLQDLQLTFPQFVDLCIMCGCDYNDNIPRVGPITSLKWIKKWRSIDQFPHEIDVSPLKYQRCRELFQVRTSQEVCKNSNEIKDFFNIQLQQPGKGGEEINKIWEKYDLGNWASQMYQLYPDFPQCYNWNREEDNQDNKVIRLVIKNS